MISSLSAAAAAMPWKTIGHIILVMLAAGIGAVVGV
jgi:hypothetical protein